MVVQTNVTAAHDWPCAILTAWAQSRLCSRSRLRRRWYSRRLNATVILNKSPKLLFQRQSAAANSYLQI